MSKKMFICAAAFLLLTMGVKVARADELHYIQPGDSLYKIAIQNGVTVSELQQANGLNGDLIYAGDKLDIPVATGRRWQPVDGRDVDLLARLITAEAGGEPFQGKVAVGSVILNRMKDPKFPATIAGNIFKPHEFESVSNGLIWDQPSEDAYKAAEAALKGWDPTGGAKFFFNPTKVYGPSWVWSRTIIQRIGNHVFGI